MEWSGGILFVKSAITKKQILVLGLVLLISGGICFGFFTAVKRLRVNTIVQQVDKFEDNRKLIDKYLAGNLELAEISGCFTEDKWQEVLETQAHYYVAEQWLFSGSIITLIFGVIIFSVYFVVRLAANLSRGLSFAAGSIRQITLYRRDRSGIFSGFVCAASKKPFDNKTISVPHSYAAAVPDASLLMTDESSSRIGCVPEVKKEHSIPARALESVKTEHTQAAKETSHPAQTDRGFHGMPVIGEPISVLKDLSEQVSAIREYATLQQNRMEKLQDGYDWGIIKGFCLKMIRCIDNLDTRIGRLSKEGGDISCLEDVRDELLFALESSGIEQFEPEPNSEYKGQERRLEAVKERRECDDDDLRGKVAEVVRRGYCYMIEEDNVKVIRPSQVKLYA